MLTQILPFSVNFLAYVKENLKSLISENYKKISAVSMVFKMLLVIGLFSLVPQNVTTASEKTYDANKTAVKLDTKKILPVVLEDKKIAIVAGTSALDSHNRVAVHGQIAYAQEPEGIQNYIDLYKSAASTYGIPWQTLAAVHYVESGASGSTNVTSYAGAQGPMQFMPGTWRAYGVDGNGDGIADAHNVNDAIYGAAHYLAAGGAADGNVNAALFNYNHAQWYVNKVNNVAASIQ